MEHTIVSYGGGTTNATNDSNAANNTVTTPVNVIDAVNDSDGKAGGTTGQTTNVGSNDQVPVGSTFAIQPGSTCANPSVSGAGVATYDVPASGSCTVNYQVCAPAPNATQCDRATLTVTAGGTDMSVSITGLPAIAPPGAVLAGAISCQNIGASTAVGATCTANAGIPAGATVVVGVCTPSSGSAAALPVGAVITCPITVTMPGTAGGGDTAQTTVGILGTNSTAMLVGLQERGHRPDAITFAASSPDASDIGSDAGIPEVDCGCYDG